MRKSKFTESQIVAITKEADNGTRSRTWFAITGSAYRLVTSGRAVTAGMPGQQAAQGHVVSAGAGHEHSYAGRCAAGPSTRMVVLDASG